MVDTAETEVTSTRAPVKRSATRPKLTAAECRGLARADARYKIAKRKLETIEAERKALIAKARAKVTIGEWVVAGGWAIKITEQNSGDRFSLSEYLKSGYKLTAAMRKHVSTGSVSARLTVEPGAEPRDE